MTREPQPELALRIVVENPVPPKEVRRDAPTRVHSTRWQSCVLGANSERALVGILGVP